MTRRALLIAISNYDPLPPLDYVVRDVPRLRAALTSAGFDPQGIEAIGAGTEPARAVMLANTRIRRSIRDFFKGASFGDNLLLFLSGHGIEFQGRRIFLPPEYDLQEPQSPEDLVWDGWVSEQARGSSAHSVIVLIDACRDGAHYELAANKSVVTANQITDRPLEDVFTQGTDGPTIAFLYSCAKGEQSGIDLRDRTCSAFTRAMAEAFEKETGPSELLALADSARFQLSIYSGGKQTLVSSGQDGRAGPWRSLTAKIDEAARFRERLERSVWVKLVEQTELFRKVKADLSNFALQISAMVLRAEERVAEAKRLLPIQHWRDDIVWKRMLDRLYSVFLASAPEHSLRSEEAAVLLVVPFVYETVLACAEIKLAVAGAVPNPELASTADHVVTAWLHAWRVDDGARMHRSLLARGQTEAANDQACWALVEFCHGSGELWDPNVDRPQNHWIPESVIALFSLAPFTEVTQDRRITEILSTTRLMRLARLMFVRFEDITLDAIEGSEQLDPIASSGEGRAQLTVNEVLLAHLLNLSARLALDARRLQPLLAEHLGTEAVSSARNLLISLDKAEWPRRTAHGALHDQGENWFDLKLECKSDAVDAALLTVVDELEEYRTRLLQRQDVHASTMRNILPAGFTANRLNADPSGWRPTRPPLRFELNRTRIITLLMGQQLYGERWPALRELYQNALDACRYRRAQQSLAIKEGRTSQTYRGRIEIRFGIENERRFVECVDDGIGMAERHVRRLFAYAGQRFADSHEFHIDRARWEEASVPFFPNSRFGIGVLSYFMLAEELDLVSRRYVPEPNASVAVRARIVGTGSLFRLEPALDIIRLAGTCGSSVRLYLRSDAGEEAALIDSILRWLWLPEVTTVIRSSRQEPIELVGGKPTDAFRNGRGSILLPIPESESTTGAARLHIAPYAGSRLKLAKRAASAAVARNTGLIDGIATELLHSNRELVAQSLVINFTEHFQVTPTVDRQKILPEAHTAVAVLECVRAKAGAALAAWEMPDLIVLHATLGEFNPRVISDLSEVLQTRALKPILLRLSGVEYSWPYWGVAISDIDPTLMVELGCATNPEFGRLYTRYRFEPSDSVGMAYQLSVKTEFDFTTHPLVEKALFRRLQILLEAGLAVPQWFRHAIAFVNNEAFEQSVPAQCREVLQTIESADRVWLRNLIDWTAPSQAALGEAMRTLIAWEPSVLCFEEERVADLSQVHLKLARLIGGNQITRLDLAYFARVEEISLEAAIEIAQELRRFGVEIPDSFTDVEGLVFTEQQIQLLRRFYDNQLEVKSRHPTTLQRILLDIRPLAILDTDTASSILLALKPFVEEEPEVLVAPDGLDWQQRLLLSGDFDGEPPFLTELTLGDLLNAVSRGEVGGIDEVVSVAKSLLTLGINVQSLEYLNQSMIDFLRTLPSASLESMRRLILADNMRRSASVWDLALFAEMTQIELAQLSAVLDLVESCGAHVARCRDFVAYVEQQSQQA